MGTVCKVKSSIYIRFKDEFIKVIVLEKRANLAPINTRFLRDYGVSEICPIKFS